MRRQRGGVARSVGFNLLPWRQREMRRLRRHRLLEWCAAAALGCACLTPLLGWQLWMRGRTDASREIVDQEAAQLRLPLAEAKRLASEAAAQRAGAELARQQAKPLNRLLTLFDALARAGTVGVVLQQIAQRGDEAELQAAAADEAAAAAWLGRLRALPEVGAVSVRELKRTSLAAGAKQRASADESIQPIQPIQVVARLVWQGASPTAKPVGESHANKSRNPK